MLAAYTHEEPLPADTEARLARFTELVGTAIANAQARVELRGFAEEQAALRRVATLAARAAPPEEVFAAVAEEVGRLLTADLTTVARYDPGGVVMVLGAWRSSGAAVPFSIGTRTSLGGQNMATLVFRTRRPARIDDYGDATGPAAGVGREWGFRAAVGAPITVEGRLWGVMTVVSTREAFLPAGTEVRLARFTELVAAAIANAQARVELRSFAEEQAALRRVATLVAGGAPPEEVFTAVTAEVGRLLEVDFTHLCRYDPDGAATTAGVWNPAGGVGPVPGETRWSLGGWNVTTSVFETGRPARIDDYGDASGAGAVVEREWGFRSAVGVPISVEGRLWGFMLAAYTHEEPLPADTEARLARFTELVATAIANAEGRAQLEESHDELRRLADEQAALRRVATLVAHSVRPDDIFAAVSNEVGRLVGSDSATVMRYDDDGEGISYVGSASKVNAAFPVGVHWKFQEGMASFEVYRTGRSARSGAHLITVDSPIGDIHRRMGLISAVASPIVVEGRLWGAMAVQSQQPLPMDTDERLERFTELLATAIANADSMSELAASRRRVIAAADDARRRIERDLHDGTQQRLVALGLALSLAQSNVPEQLPELRTQLGQVAAELTATNEELCELARGIHPAILSEGGLGPALRTLVRRAAIPVELDIRTRTRPPAPIEVAAYYVVSEALTNTTKHASASHAHVAVEERDALLYLSIRDDGIGGADPAGGSGLIGLRDRVQALSGSIEVNSRRGDGTAILIELPLHPA
jgi:signal transduction histidine kinase